MAILWLDETSGPTLSSLNGKYEIGNPKAGENTHLIDHTWLALVATAGLMEFEYQFVRQPENWSVQLTSSWYEPSSLTADFSMFEDVLSTHAGATMIVQVEHTPGRMKSDEYAEGESVTILSTLPVHLSIKTLHSYLLNLERLVSGLEGKVSTLESTVSDLTSRLEALETPTNPE